MRGLLLVAQMGPGVMAATTTITIPADTPRKMREEWDLARNLLGEGVDQRSRILTAWRRHNIRGRMHVLMPGGRNGPRKIMTLFPTGEKIWEISADCLRFWES